MTMTNMNVPKLRFTKYNDEWNTVKLGDLMEKGKAGGTPTSSNKDYYGGTIPFLSINDMTSQGKYITYTSKLITQKGLENSSAWILPKNSLLYSIYASVGFVGINLINMATSQAIYGIILKKEVNIQYLYYYLLNFKRNLHKYIETGTQGNINAKILKNFKINIPSLDEQGKIASFLSSVDNKIELLKDKKDKYVEFKHYLLQNLFPRNDELTPKLRFTEYHDEWNYTRLKDVSDIKGGKRIPKGNSLLTTSNNHPYITVSDMENNTINTTNLKYIPETVVDQLKHYTITENDIYISVAGTIGLVGKIPSILNGANLTENADKITNLKINQDFLLYLLQTDILKNLIHRTKTDNAQPKLALKEIRNMVIKYPSLSIEQCKIASFLSSVDKKIDLLDQDIKLVKEYKKGLLQNMFC